MGVTRYNEDLCNGCGICIEDCPMDVFQRDPATGKAKMVYPKDCWECLLCEFDCPTKALEVSPAAVRPLFYPYKLSENTGPRK